MPHPPPPPDPTDGSLPGDRDQREYVHELLAEYRRTGDLEVRNRIVEAHDRMVRYLAGRFSAGGTTSQEDLVQVGYLGLIAAIERYDPAKGVTFVTFAVPTILGEIKRYFRDHTWGLKAPRRLRELGLSLRKLRAQLEQRLGRPPTVPEMAEAAGVPEERLLLAMDLDRIYQPASLDAQVMEEGAEERTSFWDAIGEADPQLKAVEQREALRYAIRRLDPRQRRILYFRYFEEASQSQVAERMGISQMHVSRLERQALQKLRRILS